MTHLIIGISIIAAIALYLGQFLISLAGGIAIIAITLGVLK